MASSFKGIFLKNIIVFITHKTLSEDHARCTFYSMSFQEVSDDKKFDILFLYNTHQEELSNEFLLNLFHEYNLSKYFTEVVILNNPIKTKSLGEDIAHIRSFMINNLDSSDRVLLLKSDCVLSKNYFEEILNLKEGQVYFVAPFICAKSNVDNEEIMEYAKRDKFTTSDDITFFVEDQNNSSNNDFNNRKEISIYDKQIKFTSCYVIRDFSCHFLSVNLLGKINIQIQSWGGCNFSGLADCFVGTDKCFVIHKYHDIISENRSSDREGPVSSWLKG